LINMMGMNKRGQLMIRFPVANMTNLRRLVKFVLSLFLAKNFPSCQALILFNLSYQ